jgi:hypothetical protein
MDPEIELSYGEGSYTNSSRGSVGAYVDFGIGTLSFGIDETGTGISGVSWGNDFVHIGANPDVDGRGWSVPTAGAGAFRLGRLHQLARIMQPVERTARFQLAQVWQE